ncbi:hypothetical protein [Nonomuraea sp. NPDC046570]|uniref:hypothetical protein n=1 Tax=Nonomuraea sp. NPDC046570 TaxID=3155255 RepID=UPI003404F1BD
MSTTVYDPAHSHMNGTREHHRSSRAVPDREGPAPVGRHRHPYASDPRPGPDVMPLAAPVAVAEPIERAWPRWQDFDDETPTASMRALFPAALLAQVPEPAALTPEDLSRLRHVRDVAREAIAVIDRMLDQAS